MCKYYKIYLHSHFFPLMLQPALSKQRNQYDQSMLQYAPSTPVHLILLHQQMEWIGFAQGSWFHMIKVNLKLFAGVCLQLILPASMGSVKSKHHKNTTRCTAAHGADALLR